MNKPIHIFVRHNNKSVDRKKDVRPEWFSFQKCFDSLLVDNADITICLDGKIENHNVDFRGHEVIEFSGGSDHASFDFLLETVVTKDLDADTIVYLVEDDYLHRPGWENILIDAFKSFNVDYVTLYDHPDKYFAPMYNDLQSKLLVGGLSHWRSTPSTCNTYAGKMSTFKKHWDIHKMFCRPDITHDGYDHTKFVHLWDNGSNLISCVPGYSTHCEKPFLSPLVDWSSL